MLLRGFFIIIFFFYVLGKTRLLVLPTGSLKRSFGRTGVNAQYRRGPGGCFILSGRRVRWSEWVLKRIVGNRYAPNVRVACCTQCVP